MKRAKPDIEQRISAAFYQLASDLQRRIGAPTTDEKELRVVQARENRYGAAVFATVGMLLYWSYVAFILINMNYTYGYTQMRLPNSPGPFNSGRYTYAWALNYMLYFNILNPLLLLASVAEIKLKSRLRIHWVLNVLLIFSNLVAFFSFLGIWIGWCNTGYSFGSPCDTPLNCCVNFASPKGLTWCPVTGSGCTAGITTAQLGRWDYYFLSFLWSLFFIIYGFIAFSVNQSLKKLKHQDT